jgi:hypothetical protein
MQMVSPIAIMIPPPPPQMSMAMLRAEFRKELDRPATPAPNEVVEATPRNVDLRA